MNKLQNEKLQDKARIALNEDWEVQWWTKIFQVTPADLQEAIQQVGNSVAKVKEYLSQKV
jgi:hypothetical protein